MNTNFYPESYKDQITGTSKILLVKPSKDYDPSEDLKKLVLDKREVCFTYPKQDIDLIQEVIASECELVLQIGKPVTRKLQAFTEMTPELERQIWSLVDDKFINLHHHDEYSMRDALGTCKQLSVLLKAQNRKFMAVTNHGSIGGWIKQNNVCKDLGIKSIFGMEAYLNNYRGEDPELKKQNRKAFHLILLAQNETGYKNLIRIHNDAQINGFYYSPRTCDESLKQYGKGIIATSACMAGDINRLILEDKIEEAEIRYNFYKSCFDDFYLELQLIEMEEQKELNKKIIKFAEKVNGKLTLGLDSHYIYPENETTHSLLMCIRQKRTINDLKEDDDDTWQFTVKNLYYRDYEQLYDLFKSGFVNDDGKFVEKFEDEIFTEELFYKVCMNTRRIAVLAKDIKMDTSIKLPVLYEDSENVLRTMTEVGFKNRGLDALPNAQAYRDRLNYELDVICLSGWADYFLITKLIIDKAIELKGEWATGAGRGCFAPWSRVINGDKLPVYISDIKIGDSVYSHNGTINKVIDKYEYDVEEELLEIETEDGKTISCTKDHKILVNRNNEKVWVKAIDLTLNDDIVNVF